MADAATLNAAVARFLAHEAHLIDGRKWEEWVALFDPAATFWIPARGIDDAFPAAPEDAINLLYLESRAVLEIRVQRFTSGDTVANTPLPRTSHLVGSVLAETAADGRVRAQASFVVSATNPVRGIQQRCGRYEYVLLREADDFRILQKKVVALDEVFDGFLDVYLI